VNCGIYLLEYAESFLENPELIIVKARYHSNLLRIFPYQFIANKRKKIQEIMEMIFNKTWKTKWIT